MKPDSASQPTGPAETMLDPPTVLSSDAVGRPTGLAATMPDPPTIVMSDAAGRTAGSTSTMPDPSTMMSNTAGQPAVAAPMKLHYAAIQNNLPNGTVKSNAIDRPAPRGKAL